LDGSLDDLVAQQQIVHRRVNSRSLIISQSSLMRSSTNARRHCASVSVMLCFRPRAARLPLPRRPDLLVGYGRVDHRLADPAYAS
jgi:hypothetical protein